MFHNYATHTDTNDATEEKPVGLSRRPRWFIRSGFAGYNSPANNRDGYKSKAHAEAAILRYQSAGADNRARARRPR